MGEFGELLRNARAYRGVSLVDAERATRINRRYLAALEQEAFDQLPPLTYARGIVRIYAQYLGLDPVTVLAKFEEAHGQRSMGFRVVPAVRPVQEPLMHWAPNFAVIAFMLAISAIVFALVYTTYLAPRQQPTPTLLASTENTTPVPTVPPRLNVDTPEPIHSPAVSPSPSPAASATPNAPSAASTQAAAPEETPPPSVEPTPPPTPEAPSGEHLFEIVTTGRVWVQATVDGRIVLAEVLDAGARRTYRGQTLTVSSGNAPLVRVIVDGEDRGPLGQRWDQTATYP
uniref:Helix-turn-helix domain-containing protein n=1 Tax=Thermomicrobium roseum TaxID=500 RepID=A0A7C5VUT9_THERO